MPSPLTFLIYIISLSCVGKYLYVSSHRATDVSIVRVLSFDGLNDWDVTGQAPVHQPATELLHARGPGRGLVRRLRQRLRRRGKNIASSFFFSLYYSFALLVSTAPHTARRGIATGCCRYYYYPGACSFLLCGYK